MMIAKYAPRLGFSTAQAVAQKTFAKFLRFGDGPAEPVFVDVADLEVFVITAHPAGFFGHLIPLHRRARARDAPRQK